MVDPGNVDAMADLAVPAIAWLTAWLCVCAGLVALVNWRDGGHGE